MHLAIGEQRGIARIHLILNFGHFIRLGGGAGREFSLA
jgi:hypothetical protein